MSLCNVKERFAWLDALRVSACFGVVALHVVAPLLSSLPFTSIGWWTSNIVMSLISSCVLVFVLISGALFLTRPFHEDVGGFFGRRLSFVGQVSFWTVFYILLRWMSEPELTWGHLWNDLWRGVPYYHLWFLYMISGLYLITPVLCWCITKITRSIRRLVVICSLVLTCIMTMAGSLSSFLPCHNIVFLFLPFVPYFLLGYELFIANISGKITDKICLGVFLFTATTLSLVVFLCFSRNYQGGLVAWLSGSFSPFTLVMAVCIFRFFHAVKDAKFLLLLARLAPLTLGIYVLHPLFIRLLAHAGFPGSFVRVEFAVIVMIFAVFVWSALTVWAMSKVPYIRRLVITVR